MKRISVTEFAYDWRRSLFEAVENLLETLETIKKQTGSQVQVVAHSMGGLITLVALNKRPELFQSVLFAGCPFSSGVGFLQDLHAGTQTGTNKDILSPQVLSTFSSFWVFFPTDTNSDSCIIDEQGLPISIDLHNVDDWIKYKLGPFSFPNLPNQDEVREHIRNALFDAKLFRKAMIANPLIDCPVGVLSSQSVPTLTQIVKTDLPTIAGSSTIRGYNFEIAKRPMGDGRLQMKDAIPKGVSITQTWETDQGHGSLLNDPRVPDYLALLATK